MTCCQGATEQDWRSVTQKGAFWSDFTAYLWQLMEQNHQRYKSETPQKVEVFCRVSNILCRSLDTQFGLHRFHSIALQS